MSGNLKNDLKRKASPVGLPRELYKPFDSSIPIVLDDRSSPDLVPHLKAIGTSRPPDHVSNSPLLQYVTAELRRRFSGNATPSEMTTAQVRQMLLILDQTTRDHFKTWENVFYSDPTTRKLRSFAGRINSANKGEKYWDMEIFDTDPKMTQKERQALTNRKVFGTVRVDDFTNRSEATRVVEKLADVYNRWSGPDLDLFTHPRGAGTAKFGHDAKFGGLLISTTMAMLMPAWERSVPVPSILSRGSVPVDIKLTVNIYDPNKDAWVKFTHVKRPTAETPLLKIPPVNNVRFRHRGGPVLDPAGTLLTEDDQALISRGSISLDVWLGYERLMRVAAARLEGMYITTEVAEEFIIKLKQRYVEETRASQMLEQEVNNA